MGQFTCSVIIIILSLLIKVICNNADSVTPEDVDKVVSELTPTTQTGGQSAAESQGINQC